MNNDLSFELRCLFAGGPVKGRNGRGPNEGKKAGDQTVLRPQSRLMVNSIIGYHMYCMRCQYENGC